MKPQVFPSAWVTHKGQTYFSRSPQIDVHSPTSPTIKLLQGIFDLHKDLSFFILRNRIYLNYTPLPRDLGMLKLIAKRFSAVSPDQAPNFSEAHEIGSLSEDFFAVRAERVTLSWQEEVLSESTQQRAYLLKLEEQIPQGEVKHDFPRKIAAIALDENSKVFATAAHSGWINKTLHAEVCLIQDLHKRGFRILPAKAKLILSMKPCAMCAGMIFDFLPKNFSGEIIYLREDPGPMARATALDGNPQLIQLTESL